MFQILKEAFVLLVFFGILAFMTYVWMSIPEWGSKVPQNSSSATYEEIKELQWTQ